MLKNGLRLIALFNIVCTKIEKYNMWKEKKAVQIGFTKITLGKLTGQNDKVIYFTK